MTVIEIKNVSKKYQLKHKKDQLKIFSKIKEEEFYALKNINLNIKKGECLGIIGENGSGKTTMLKIIAEIIKPTSGELIVEGRILSLLDVGAGFQEELTGRENIYLYGSLLGFSKTQIKSKLKEIVAFSNLNDFIDVKLKNYSSGMKVRLAFSTAMSHDPDILLIDEIMSIGDEIFQKKSYNKILSLRDEGKTIIFVSHDLNVVKKICSRVVYLKNGKIVQKGTPNDVIYTYLKEVSKSNYYNINILKDKISHLNKINENIKLLEKQVNEKPSNDLLAILKTYPRKRLKKESDKRKYVKNDILTQIRYTSNLLRRDINILENQLKMYEDLDLINTITSQINKLIFCIRYEIKIITDRERQLELMEETRGLLSKKLSYITNLNEKSTVYTEMLKLILNSLKESNNPYFRLARIQELVNIYSQVQFPQFKKQSLLKEIKEILRLKEKKIDHMTEDISKLGDIYESICLKYQFFPKESKKMDKEIKKLCDFMVRNSKKDQRKKIVIDFVFNEMNARLHHPGFNVKLKSLIFSNFLITLHKLNHHLTKNEVSLINHIYLSFFNEIEQKVIKLKYQPESEKILNNLKEYSQIRKELLLTHKNLLQQYGAKDKTKKIHVLDMWFSDLKKERQERFSKEEPVVVNVKFKANSVIENPVFHVVFLSDTGHIISSLMLKNIKLKNAKIIRHVIDNLNLSEGDYYTSCSVHSNNMQYDLKEKLSYFTVTK